MAKANESMARLKTGLADLPVDRLDEKAPPRPDDKTADTLEKLDRDEVAHKHGSQT